MKKKSILVLKPTEEKIFNLLQKHEFLSVSGMSKKLNIARTSIYNSLESLKAKKIIFKNSFSYSLNGNDYTRHKFNQFDSLVQIKKFFDELVTLKKGEIIYSIETDEEIRCIFNDRGNFLDWQKKISNKGIILKGIGSLSALDYFKRMLDVKENEIIKNRSGSARFFDELLSGNCTLVVFGESVVFLSRSKKYFYRINNVFVAGFLKGIIDKIYVNLKHEKPWIGS